MSSWRPSSAPQGEGLGGPLPRVTPLLVSPAAPPRDARARGTSAASTPGTGGEDVCGPSSQCLGRRGAAGVLGTIYCSGPFGGLEPPCPSRLLSCRCSDGPDPEGPQLGRVWPCCSPCRAAGRPLGSVQGSSEQTGPSQGSTWPQGQGWARCEGSAGGQVGPRLPRTCLLGTEQGSPAPGPTLGGRLREARNRDSGTIRTIHAKSETAQRVWGFPRRDGAGMPRGAG